MINVSQRNGKSRGSIRDNVQRNLKRLNVVSFILQLIDSWKYRFLYFNLHRRYIIYNCTRLCLVTRSKKISNNIVYSLRINSDTPQDGRQTIENNRACLNIYNIDSRIWRKFGERNEFPVLLYAFNYLFNLFCPFDYKISRQNFIRKKIKCKLFTAFHLVIE